MGRCYRSTDRSYKNYGGRGIRVTSEWIKDISVFRAWILSELERQNISLETFLKHSKDFQLDRIDVNGHYTPKNCRITSPQSNARNKRNSYELSIESAEGEIIKLRGVEV